MNKDLSLSVIFPVYNEGDNIEKTVEDSIDFLEQQNIFSEYEIIAVDDGSADRTSCVLNELARTNRSLKVITHPRNLGYGRALVSGVREARLSWVLIMDADGQFRIRSIREMLGFVEHYDIIAGYRYKRADSFYRMFLGKVYSFFACFIFGLRLKDINCGFKLMRKNKINFESVTGHAGVFYTEMFLKARSQGCRIKEVPIEHFSRTRGSQTGASLKVVYEAVMDFFRLCFVRMKGGNK